MNTENNKLIADFMNCEPSYMTDHLFIDWNLLMQIVEKIESILPDDSVVTIEYKDCYIPVLENEEPFTIQGNGTSKLEAVYNACMEFITYYNEQQN